MSGSSMFPVPQVEGHSFAHTFVTSTTKDHDGVPVVIVQQTECSGRVVEYALKLTSSTVLREPMPDLRRIMRTSYLPQTAAPAAAEAEAGEAVQAAQATSTAPNKMTINVDGVDQTKFTIPKAAAIPFRKNFTETAEEETEQESGEEENDPDLRETCGTRRAPEGTYPECIARYQER